MSFDSDRDLDEWSFFTLIAEDVEELRRRVQRKLGTLPRQRRADLIVRAGYQITKLVHDLRQAHNAATKAAGGKPRPVVVVQASRT